VIECIAAASIDSPFMTVRHLYEFTSPSPVHKRVGSVRSKRTLYDDLKVEETPLQTTDKHWEDSMKKKRAQQEQQHKKMQRQFSNLLQAFEVTPGAVLIVKVDSRDISHTTGIPGIAWRIGNGGGVRIATQYGILSSRNRREEYCICHTTSGAYTVVQMKWQFFQQNYSKYATLSYVGSSLNQSNRNAPFRSVTSNS
jgi:hypothetical protein